MLAGTLGTVRTASRAASTVVGFDDLSAETVVTNQYQAQGVVFGAPGLLPVVKDVGSVEAQSGTQVANISTCSCEFYTPLVTGAVCTSPRIA